MGIDDAFCVVSTSMPACSYFCVLEPIESLLLFLANEHKCVRKEGETIPFLLNAVLFLMREDF